MGEQTLPIADIRIDVTVVPRLVTNREMVKHLAGWGRKFPLPAVVIFFDGSTYWLADGKHRIEAAKERGDTTIECDVRAADKAAATWYAAGANREHGVPLTNKEKRQAVTNLFGAKQFVSATDEAIAEQVGCSAAAVKQVRDQLFPKTAAASPQCQRRTTKAGTQIRMTPAIQSPKSGAGHPSKAREAARAKRSLEDAVGVEIPKWLRSVAEEACDFDTFLTELDAVVKRSERLRAARHGSGALLDVPEIAEHVEAIRKVIRRARFYGACPECAARGKAMASCACAGRGWYNKSEYTQRILA